MTKGEKMEKLEGARILVCKKSCKGLDRFGNGLCHRRTVEQRSELSVHYVGHTPEPGQPAEFLTGVSKAAFSERGICRRGYVDFQSCDLYGSNEAGLIPLTPEEVASIPRQEIDDSSDFICPGRRHWAKESKIQRCVIVEHNGETVLVDQWGEVLDSNGKEIILAIEVPIPGNPGSEKVTYYPTSCGHFNGKSYFFRYREMAPESLQQVEKFLFRSSPEVKLEIGESEVLIIQKPVDSSDWNHQFDIYIYRAGDSIAKHKSGVKRFLLKPGEKINLQESFEGGFSQWYTEEMTFENKGGRLVKYKANSKAFAIEQAETLKSAGLSHEDAWKIIRAAGPGASVSAFKYGSALIKDFPDKGDTLMTVLAQKGPAKSQMGRDRARGVIESLGFPVPESRNSGEFFRILAGARVVVHLFCQDKYSLAGK
jgi:hypothetical protein